MGRDRFASEGVRAYVARRRRSVGEWLMDQENG